MGPSTLFLIFTVILLLLVIMFVFILPYMTIPDGNLESTQMSTWSPERVKVTNLDLYGDMGNNMFSIAALLGIEQPVEILLPAKIEKLPIYELFDLSSLNIIDSTGITGVKIIDSKAVKIIDFHEYENYAPIVIDPLLTLDPNTLINIKGYR